MKNLLKALFLLAAVSGGILLWTPSAHAGWGIASTDPNATYPFTTQDLLVYGVLGAVGLMVLGILFKVLSSANGLSKRARERSQRERWYETTVPVINAPVWPPVQAFEGLRGESPVSGFQIRAASLNNGSSSSTLGRGSGRVKRPVPECFLMDSD